MAASYSGTSGDRSFESREHLPATIREALIVREDASIRSDASTDEEMKQGLLSSTD